MGACSLLDGLLLLLRLIVQKMLHMHISVRAPDDRSPVILFVFHRSMSGSPDERRARWICR
jgi:hypothetical protein